MQVPTVQESRNEQDQRVYRGKLCPRCEGHLYRLPRTISDLLLSCVVPVRRYRCRSARCGWEGILRNTQISSSDAEQDALYHYREIVIDSSCMGSQKDPGRE
jgi:hypothetical protein